MSLFFFFFSNRPAGWINFSIQIFNVDGGILAAKVMYSESREISPHSQNTLLPVALIEQGKSDRLVVQKSISRTG